MSTISNPLSFREEARFQRCCAVCGATGEYEAHHIVPKQRLKKKGLVHKLYDPRNALRLCRRCHAEYTARNLTIETSELPSQSICFIWEVLGVAGANFLERDYSGVDRRYTRHPEGACPCQHQS